MSQNKIKSPVHNALPYTLLISIINIIYQFASPAQPSGTEFISHIVFVVFPFLIVILCFNDKNTPYTFKKNMFKNDSDDLELHSRETLREYHAILKEGIITQEEYDNIKKKDLKSLHKD